MALYRCPRCRKVADCYLRDADGNIIGEPTGDVWCLGNGGTVTDENGEPFDATPHASCQMESAG